MEIGSSVITSPLPLDNPEFLGEGVFIVKDCPGCGRGYKCSNFISAECGCAYHQFCLAADIGASLGPVRCARPECELLWSDDCLDANGAISIQVSQPKSREGKASRTEGRSLVTSASTNCKYVTFAQFFPVTTSCLNSI